MNSDQNNPVISPQLRSARLGAIVLYGTFGLLMFGPLAFGTVEPWSIFLLQTGAVVLTLLWLAKQWLDQKITLSWNPLFLPIAAFGVLILLQIVFRTSAYHHDTISGAMLYISYGLLCFLATQTLVRTTQARRIAVILALYGFALAAFALLQGVSANGKIYWTRVPRMGGWIYGPYVNHNHYAGIMELLVPIPLVLCFSRLVPERGRIMAGIAAAIMIGTIFLSGSRGGMIAIFAELALFATVLFRQKKRVRIAIAAVAFAVVLVSLLSWLGGKELTARVSSISSEARTEISGGMRLSIDRDALQMFRQRPVLGWGLRTFPVVYPQFRSFYTNFFVNEAHNDYMQLLTEMGLLGFAVMVWFLVVLYRRALGKIANWTTKVTGAVTLACVLGATGILVHSFFDFNLQIPANAAWFYVYCSLASASPLLQRTRKRKPIETEPAEVLPASEVV
jgi:O-antigen ligase